MPLGPVVTLCLIRTDAESKVYQTANSSIVLGIKNGERGIVCRLNVIREFKIPLTWKLNSEICVRRKENLIRPTHHVSALFLQSGVPLPHLVPDAAQRVVRQEFDDVSRREELVAKGQFV